MTGRGGVFFANSGEKILNEINEESLFQLLCDVGSVIEPEDDVHTLHIRQIDDFIRSLRSTVPIKDIYPVLELTSASSAAGKTSLLYYIAAKAVLPKNIDGIDLGGSNAAVVFIDTEKRFDANRLHDIALGIILRGAEKQGRNPLKIATDCQYFLKSISDALQHVHIFRPSSSAELLTTLTHLSPYLLHQRDERGRVMPEHHSAFRPIHSVCIDSASAFYYQDARANELARLVLNEGRTNGAASDVEPHQFLPDITASTTAKASDLVSSLCQIQRTFRCVVIFTTWGLYPRSVWDRASQPDGNDIGNRNDNDFSGWSGQNAKITYILYLTVPVAALNSALPDLALKLTIQKTDQVTFACRVLTKSDPRCAGTDSARTAKRFQAYSEGFSSAGNRE
ncbi:hypothetical protein KEM54_002595, partial [Ascosphaera aggregata]